MSVVVSCVHNILRLSGYVNIVPINAKKLPADEMAGICYDVYQNLTLLGPTLLGTPLWRYRQWITN